MYGMIQRRRQLADSWRMHLKTIEGLHDVPERRVRVLDEDEQSNAIKGRRRTHETSYWIVCFAEQAIRVGSG